MFQFSFYRRIQVSFITLILLPIMTISLLTYVTTKNTVMEKIHVTNKSVLDMMAKDIEKLIDDITYASHFYVQNTEIHEHLRLFKGIAKIETFDDYRKYTQIQNFYDQVAINALDRNIRLFLVNDAGFIIPYLDFNSGQTLPRMQRDLEALRTRIAMDMPKKLQWLGTVPGDNDNESFYYISRVIRDSETGELLATLHVGISSKYFDQYFEAFPGGSFALFDHDGKRIAGSPSMSATASKTSEAQAIRSEAPVSQGGWKLVYETPKEAATGQITQAFFVSAMSVAVFSVIFLVLSFVLAKRLHLPIRKLQLLAKQFGGGNRSVRFPEAGKDEIGDLGRSFNSMLDEINRLIADIEQEQEQKRVLELQALFAQIRPHFLLNTLNSIKCSLMLTEDKRHGRMIDSLTSLLRAYMKVNEPTTLQKECALLRHYLDIMNMRNELSLELHVDLPKALETFKLPMLLLQPIVENSIVHGFIEKESGGRIEVSAAQTDGRTIIRIADNGCGMSAAKLQEMQALLRQDPDQHGAYRRVGLMNVLQRLRLTYGMGAIMSVEANEDEGITVIVSMPA